MNESWTLDKEENWPSEDDTPVPEIQPIDIIECKTCRGCVRADRAFWTRELSFFNKNESFLSTEDEDWKPEKPPFWKCTPELVPFCPECFEQIKKGLKVPRRLQ